MDPNATLNDLITAILDGDFFEAHERLNELHTWRARGGFAPQDPRPGLAQEPGAGWAVPTSSTR